MLLPTAATYTIPINPRTRTALSSSATSHGTDGSPSSARTLRKKMKENKKKKQRPSVFEVQRAIGVVDADDNQRKQNGGSTANTMVDMLGSTPIGQKESSIEQKIRKTSEWVVKQTEPNALAGQKTILVLCMKILPVWVFLLLVASGVLKLPFHTPFLDNLFS